MGESYISPSPKPVTYDPHLERGLKGMRGGKSLSASARSIGNSPDQLRRYLNRAGVIEKRGPRWAVAEDDRPRETVLYTDGQIVTVTVADFGTASVIGRYMVAVRNFLESNDPDDLAPFVGESVTDMSGRVWQLETRPNVLFRLNAAGGETFEQVYRIVM
jgi:hypothetical protein